MEVLEYDAKKKVHRLGQNVGHIEDGRIMVTPEYFSKTFFSQDIEKGSSTKGTGNLDNLFNLSDTANEFGDTSDTYKIIYDLMNLYSSSEDSLQKEKYHSLAVDALQKAREGTPCMYGNDIVMETLHTNLAEMIGVQVVNRELYNPIEAYVATFTYLTAKHFKIGDEVNWDYKWDPNWQVPYDYFNGSDMNKVEPSDGSSVMYH